MSKISFLIPVYNEADFLGACLDSVLANEFDFAATGSEILVIDGQSNDGTRDVVVDFAERYSFIRLLDNPGRIQSKGLNIGLAEAKGEIIFRLDGHSAYPPNYVADILKHLISGEADNVGGGFDSTPGADTRKARAISMAMNSKLGVGITYRSVTEGGPRYVDTVPYGAWKREVFDRIGDFDESFIRTQDFEFNTRMRQNGLRIMFLPWLQIRYHARETFAKLWAMSYQYGYWKVKVNKKHRILASYRQLLPAILVMGEFLLLLAALSWPPARVVFFGANGLYLVVLSIGAIIRAARGGDLLLAPYFVLACMVMHFGYGLGYLRGLLSFYVLGGQETKNARLTGVTR